ncbi:MAG: linear amide C-N hydrolase [Thermotogota bacterium]
MSLKVKKASKLTLFFVFFLLIQTTTTLACTGIQLIGQDGTVVRGRTNEWGDFNMQSQAAVYPRGLEFQGLTPDGKNGIVWQVKHGFVAFQASEGVTMDGMNEAGLSVGAFLHKGFAEYSEYDPEYASISLSPIDIVTFILSNFATIDAMKSELEKIRIVPVVDPVIGKAWPGHLMASDKNGACVVIEFIDGSIQITDNPVGVITNNPTFDWHLTNLRNYGYLSSEPFDPVKWGELTITPLAGGSGMLGLPGDFTSPSRFIRAVVFSQYSRKTTGGYDTVKELFRILDSFNVGPHLAEGSDGNSGDQMPSATQWTIANDTANLTIYYHTMYNRRVRKIDLEKIDFVNGEKMIMPLDKDTKEDIEDVTVNLQ